MPQYDQDVIQYVEKVIKETHFVIWGKKIKFNFLLDTLTGGKHDESLTCILCKVL